MELWSSLFLRSGPISEPLQLNRRLVLWSGIGTALRRGSTACSHSSGQA